MITTMPSEAELQSWKEIWEAERERIVPCRKSGSQLVDYLMAMYEPEELDDPEIREVVSFNVTGNENWAEKLPAGSVPEVRVFRVGDSGNGAILHAARTALDMEAPSIVVGIDISSGFYYVEGSEALWDELCAYQGVDAEDLRNYVCTAMYVLCSEKRTRVIGKAVTVTVDRPLGSAHPDYPDMIYPANYGYVSGIVAPDGDFQDAYILGPEVPLESFRGVVAAVITRSDDAEDKWVVVPEGLTLTEKEIKNSVEFQERWFDSRVFIK